MKFEISPSNEKFSISTPRVITKMGQMRQYYKSMIKFVDMCGKLTNDEVETIITDNSLSPFYGIYTYDLVNTFYQSISKSDEVWNQKVYPVLIEFGKLTADDIVDKTNVFKEFNDLVTSTWDSLIEVVRFKNDSVDIPKYDSTLKKAVLKLYTDYIKVPQKTLKDLGYTNAEKLKMLAKYYMDNHHPNGRIEKMRTKVNGIIDGLKPVELYKQIKAKRGEPIDKDAIHYIEKWRTLKPIHGKLNDLVWYSTLEYVWPRHWYYPDYFPNDICKLALAVYKLKATVLDKIADATVI